MAQAHFCSWFGNARISFPPEQFGLVETDEMQLDSHGDVVVDRATNEYMKKRAARPAIVIKGADKPLITDDEDLIKCLRNHSGNKANGGQTFWEETEEVMDAIKVAQGITVAHIPEGGMLDEDVELVRTLYKYSKRIPPPAQDSAMQKLGFAIERFTIRGVTIPPREKGIRILKARMIEALSAMEDAGIATADPGDVSEDDQANDAEQHQAAL